jgi:chromosome segregation ATPase
MEIATLLTENATLQENFKTLERANKQNVETIDQMDSLYSENLNNFNRLQQDFQTMRSRNNQLRERLNSAELNSRSLSSPQEMERSLNTSTRNSFRCMEILSGSPLTQRENASVNANDFNPECPWIFEQRVLIQREISRR